MQSAKLVEKELLEAVDSLKLCLDYFKAFRLILLFSK